MVKWSIFKAVSFAVPALANGRRIAEWLNGYMVEWLKGLEELNG